MDTPCRFGGDEFALILPQAYTDGATVVAERLRTSIEQIEIPGFGHLTASIGIAAYPLHGASRAALVSAADMALYSAKRAGRNRVAVFDAPEDGAADLFASRRHLSETIEHAM